jgi:hypothetical protein
MPELSARPAAGSAVTQLATRREGRHQKANRPYEAVVAFSIVLANVAPVLLVALGLAVVLVIKPTQGIEAASNREVMKIAGQVADERAGVLLISSAQSEGRPSTSRAPSHCHESCRRCGHGCSTH